MVEELAGRELAGQVQLQLPTQPVLQLARIEPRVPGEQCPGRLDVPVLEYPEQGQRRGGLGVPGSEHPLPHTPGDVTALVELDGVEERVHAGLHVLLVP